jgi:hypothetical protein
MPRERSSGAEGEIALLIERLRAEARASGVPGQGLDRDAALGPLSTRREAEELWAVTSDRAFMAMPRTRKMRGALLKPVKLVLRKLIRWYVEPAFSDQRTFNATVLRLVDEAHAQTGTTIARLEERLARLEQRELPDSRPR